MAEFVTDDDCTLYYEPYGFGREGDVVVFLNGMTQSTAHWKSQAKGFAKRGFRVLTYDARGQGQSDLGDRDITLELHAHDLAALLDAVDVERAHLVGFSHGARVALGAANFHPDRLDRLVLCSATAESTALARTIVRSWHQILTQGGLEAMSWSALPTILGNDFLAQNEAILDGIVRAATQRNTKEGVHALLEALMDFPELDQLTENVEAPTLVVSADEDLLVTADGARKLADLLDGDHRLIEGVGHTIPIEAPEEFRDVVAAFLSTS